MFKKSIAGKVYCMEHPYYSSNVEKDPDFHIDINSERKILSISCCPIKRNDITVAVLSLDGIKEESFDPDERAYLENCANIIGLIMQAEDIHENFLIIQYERGLGNEKQNDQNKSA